MKQQKNEKMNGYTNVDGNQRNSFKEVNNLLKNRIIWFTINR